MLKTKQKNKKNTCLGRMNVVIAEFFIALEVTHGLQGLAPAISFNYNSSLTLPANLFQLCQSSVSN